MRRADSVLKAVAQRYGAALLRNLTAIGVVAISLALAGCNGGDDEAEDLFTVQGNVSAFAGVAADLRVFAAGVSGVAVSIKATNYRTTTSGDGSFRLMGVPIGDHVLIFESAGAQGEYQISAPCAVVITLANVAVLADGSVRVAGVTAAPAFTPHQIEGDAPVIGTWSGTASGKTHGSNAATFVFNANGSLNVHPTDGTGAGTYGVSGSKVYGIFAVGDGEIAFSAAISGNSMSGRWAKYNVFGDQGSLSLTKQ